jgi:formate/nitrite transporter FocA (FNT family)
MGNQQLTRAVILGAVAAGVLVGLFLLVYWLLGTAGASQSVQLFGALLAPPAILGAGLAVVAQMRAKQ